MPSIPVSSTVWQSPAGSQCYETALQYTPHMFTTVAQAVPKMSIDKIVTDVTGSLQAIETVNGRILDRYLEIYNYWRTRNYPGLLRQSLKIRKIASSHSEKCCFSNPRISLHIWGLKSKVKCGGTHYYRCTLDCKLLLWSTPKKKCERHKSLKWWVILFRAISLKWFPEWKGSLGLYIW